jgi:hypothetical protein
MFDAELVRLRTMAESHVRLRTMAYCLHSCVLLSSNDNTQCGM